MTTILEYIGYAFVAFELCSLVLALIAIPRIIREYRINAALRSDFLLNVQSSISKILFKGRINTMVSIIASEIAMFRYALFFRMGSEERLPQQQTFTTYKKSGYSTLFPALLCIGVVEIVGVHILVSVFWNSTTALVVTLLGVYTLLFVVADYSALVKRPIVLEDTMLLVRIGTRWVAEIPYANIASVAAAPKLMNTEVEAGLTKLVSFGKGTVILQLHEPTSLLGHYGIRKSLPTLTCSIDDPSGFMLALHEKMLEPAL